MLVLGMGFLSQREAQSRAAKMSLFQLQARALAEAGLEDARAKLSKRHSFPPLAGMQQRNFQYSETLSDTAGNPVGVYLVEVDMSFADGPTWILKITSRGIHGTFDDPLAEYVLHAEMDVSEFDRVPIARSIYNPNPDRFKTLYTKVGKPQ